MLGLGTDSFIESMFEKVAPPDIELDEIDIDRRQRDVLISLLSRKVLTVNILLFGKPGSGKTTLATALGQALGFDAIGIPSDHSKDASERMSVVKTAAALFRGKDVLVVVDEADEILSTESSFLKKSAFDNGALNRHLERSGIKTIWIANRIDNLPESALRRFDFIIKFKDISLPSRVRAWNRVLKDSSSGSTKLDGHQIEKLAERFRFSPGVISKAVSNASPDIPGVDLDKSHLEAILEGYGTVIPGMQAPKLPSPTLTFRQDFVKTSEPLAAVRESIQGYVERVKDPERLASTKGLFVLFHGVSGGGKTHFGRYLAQDMGMKLRYTKATDFLNPYIGMGEASCAKVFRESQEEGSILFIDECDSFLRSRERARHSWEVSLTNALLVEMDAFRGVLICATNMIDALDSAALRRWHFKVEFLASDLEARMGMFREMLEPLAIDRVSSEVAVRELSPLGLLTPGDFEAIRHRFIYQIGPTCEQLIEALKAENGLKSRFMARPVGF